MNGRTIGIIILVIVVLGGIVWYVSSNNEAGMSATTPTTTVDETASTGPVMVSYTNTGFSPADITVTEGQSVTWTNNSSHMLWVASDPHPAHSGYDGTSRDTHCAAGYAGPAPLDECTQVPAGGTFTFVFDKVGTWGYHNHAVDEDRGSVTVVAASATDTTASSTDTTASTSAGLEINVQ